MPNNNKMKQKPFGQCFHEQYDLEVIALCSETSYSFVFGTNNLSASGFQEKASLWKYNKYSSTSKPKIQMSVTTHPNHSPLYDKAGLLLAQM